MNFSWGGAKRSKTDNAYLDWFDHVYQPGRDGAFGYDITLVRLKPTGSPASIKTTLTWLAAQADQATAASDFILDDVERVRIAALIQDPPRADVQVDVFLHQKRSVENFAKTYKAEFVLIPNGAARPKSVQTAKPTKPMLAPIVAVIDDAIGYLNARFTSDASGTRKTRLHGVWLQTQDQLVKNGSHVSMQNGLQVDAASIDALLAKGPQLDEAAEYAAVNDRLFGHEISPIWNGVTAGAGSELASTHGTTVCDIAGGAEPTDEDDALRDCPMLAVQLPPKRSKTLQEPHCSLMWCGPCAGS